MFHLLSLGLGLVSWGLGAAAVWKKGRGSLTVFSMALCIGAMYFQFCEVNRLVNKGDWAAIEDTFPAVALAAGVLTAVTLALNLTALFRSKGR